MKQKYIEVKCDKETQERMSEWCSCFGYDLTKDWYGNEQTISKFNFHTTIMYSSNTFSLKNISKKIWPIRGKAIRLEMLGNMNTIPALIIDSPALLKLHKSFSKMGLKHSYPVFLPHISVSYAETSPYYVENILPDFDIVYDELVIEDIV